MWNIVNNTIYHCTLVKVCVACRSLYYKTMYMYKLLRMLMSARNET